MVEFDLESLQEVSRSPINSEGKYQWARFVHDYTNHFEIKTPDDFKKHALFMLCNSEIYSIRRVANPEAILLEGKGDRYYFWNISFDQHGTPTLWYYHDASWTVYYAIKKWTADGSMFFGVETGVYDDTVEYLWTNYAVLRE